MANFCTKCGSALVEGNNFCTSCGASVGGSSASAAPAAAGAAPAAAASPKSGGALKVILIVVGVFIGLGILGGMAVTFGLWRLSRSVNVNRSGQVSINTPGGKREEGSFQLSTAEGTMATYVFKTSDTPAQVMAFYRGKLNPKTNFLETPDGGMITSDNSATVGFLITVGRDNADGRTSISVVRGTSKKAQ